MAEEADAIEESEESGSEESDGQQFNDIIKLSPSDKARIIRDFSLLTLENKVRGKFLVLGQPPEASNDHFSKKRSKHVYLLNMDTESMNSLELEVSNNQDLDKTFSE